MARYRLKRLEAAHWRGICEMLSVPLDQPLTVIVGPNGAGKSSLLTAIEFALFPRETVRISEHHIAERRGWEPRHMHGHEYPFIRLTLSQKGRDVEVGTRSGAGQSPVRARYADFRGLAYLHQETIRDFIIGAPQARQNAFQRLLGAGWAQDLAKSFDDAAKRLDVDEADATVERLEAHLHTRLLEARRQLEPLEAEAAAAGIAPPWRDAEERLIAEAAELEKAPAPALPGVSAAARKLRLESWRTAWEASLERRKAAAAPDAGQLTGLVAERDGLSESLRALDRFSALLRDALAHARLHPDGHECPVCQQPASLALLAPSLESRLGQPMTDEAARLRTRLAEVNAAIAATDRARADAARAEAEVERARQELAGLLGRPLRAAEDPAALAAQEIAALEQALVRETQAAGAARDRLAIQDRVNSRLALVRRVAIQQMRVARLAGLRETEAWRAMLDARRRLSVRELMLQHAAGAVKQHATQLASDNLERARKPIGNIFAQLTRRADFPAVAIFPQDKFEVNLAGAGNRVVGAAGVLNLTDLNCLALAVTAGMAVAFPAAHDLDFLILDDPSQGMDQTVTARLAPILGHLARRIQVLVATPDETLAEALRAQPLYKTVVRLEPRDEKDPQPRVRIASVES